MRTNRAESRAGSIRMKLLVVIAIIVVVVGWIMPAFRQASEATDHSITHLKQQALDVVDHISAKVKEFTGSKSPWQNQAPPYLEHDDVSGWDQSGIGGGSGSGLGGGGGTSAGALPWQGQSSPYVNHKGL